MDYKNSFVVYESVYAQFERMVKSGNIDGANAYIDAIMQYGLYGVVPPEEDSVWLYGLDNVFASIDSAKAKYSQKINIPEAELIECLQKGMTKTKIADYFGCSTDTIRRRIKEYGLETFPPKDYFYFDGNAAESGKETSCSYHSHSLSHSDSSSYSHTDYESEKKSSISAEIKALGF